MTTTNNSLLTALECKMLEWMNVDIDHAEVAYKDHADQFEALFKESEEAFVTLKENKSVDALTERLKTDGYEIVSGPRTTGDGYYESCIISIENNRIEMTI